MHFSRSVTYCEYGCYAQIKKAFDLSSLKKSKKVSFKWQQKCQHPQIYETFSNIIKIMYNKQNDAILGKLNLFTANSYMYLSFQEVCQTIYIFLHPLY